MGRGTGTGRRESLVKRYGTERSMIGTTSVAGSAAREGETIYITWVCVVVRAVLRGEVGEAGRRRYVQSVSEHITSETVGTGECIPPYMKFPR